MPVTLIALALLSMTRPSIDVSVDSTNGDVVSKIHEFHVKVGETKGVVTQVEFYVNHDLRDTVTSIPYNFKLDTINEDEGKIDLEWRVYTTEGENGKKQVSVTIDNLVSQGVDFHVQQAQNYLTQSQFDDAILEGRIAFKIKAGYNPARIAMARAYMAKGSYDRAQKYAEDAVASDPNDAQATELLSVVNLGRAFATYSRNADAGESNSEIRDALKAGVGARVKLEGDKLDKIVPGGDTLLQYADLALSTSHYTQAIAALKPVFNRDVSQTNLANRLLFAYIRLGRYTEAKDVLRVTTKFGKPNAYTLALKSLVEAATGDKAGSDKDIAAAKKLDPSNLGVQTASASLAFRFGKFNDFSDAINAFGKEYAATPEVKVYSSEYLSQQGNYSQAREYFVDVVKTNPTLTDAYVMEGAAALRLAIKGNLDDTAVKNQYLSAETMFLTALEIVPNSAEALTGLSITALAKKDINSAIKYGVAASAASPSYAAGFYALGIARLEGAKALSASIKKSDASDAAREATKQSSEMLRLSSDALYTAGQLDPARLSGRNTNDYKTAFEYFERAGRTPLVSQP